MRELGRRGLGLRGRFRSVCRVAALGTLTAAFGHGFGAADHKLTTHVFLIVKLVDRTLSLLDGRKLDESESFGTLCLAVANNLDVLDGANTTEEFQQVAFACIKREIANVDAGRRDFDTLGLPGLARRAAFTTLRMLATGRALWLSRGLGLLFATESEDGEELRKETLLLGRLLLAARTVFAAVCALRTTLGSRGAPAATATAGTTTVRGIIGGHGMCCVKGSPRFAVWDTGPLVPGIRTWYVYRYVVF